MTEHRFEKLAVELASMSNEAREWVLVRMKDLLKLKRAAGERLSGKKENKWGRLVAGGLLYDADGEVICRVQRVNITSSADDVSRYLHPLQVNEHRRERVTIEITAHAMEDR